MNWQRRYGNIKKYKRQCAIAHKSVKGLCCVCLKSVSQELHHASYGNDVIGVSVFPVCRRCHQSQCHSSRNWVKDPKNPIMGNHNTASFTRRLKLGYQLLYLKR